MQISWNLLTCQHIRFPESTVFTPGLVFCFHSLWISTKSHFCSFWSAFSLQLLKFSGASSEPNSVPISKMPSCITALNYVNSLPYRTYGAQSASVLRFMLSHSVWVSHQWRLLKFVSVRPSWRWHVRVSLGYCCLQVSVFYFRRINVIPQCCWILNSDWAEDSTTGNVHIKSFFFYI